MEELKLKEEFNTDIVKKTKVYECRRSREIEGGLM